MSMLVPVSEAKARLNELVRDSQDENVTLLRHGRPVAHIISVGHYEEILRRLEDAEDRLSLHERENVTMDYEKLSAELGFID